MHGNMIIQGALKPGNMEKVNLTSLWPVHNIHSNAVNFYGPGCTDKFTMASTADMAINHNMYSKLLQYP